MNNSLLCVKENTQKYEIANKHDKLYNNTKKLRNAKQNKKPPFIHLIAKNERLVICYVDKSCDNGYSHIL